MPATIPTTAPRRAWRLLGDLGLGQLDLLAHEQARALGDLRDRLGDRRCLGSSAGKALDEEGEGDAAQESGADGELRSLVGRGPSGQRSPARRRARAAASAASAACSAVGCSSSAAGVGWRSRHSGGSSPNARTQIIVASRASRCWPARRCRRAGRTRQAASPSRSQSISARHSISSPGGGRGRSTRPARRRRLDDGSSWPARIPVHPSEQREDPAGQHLLDRAVERQRREVRRDVGLKSPRAWARSTIAAIPSYASRIVREVRASERVRGARDLDDDDLHQVGVVAVGVDDERGDRVELLARRDLLARRPAGSRAAARPSARGRACRAPRPSSRSSGRRGRRRRPPRRRCRRRGRCGSPGARTRARPRPGSCGACRRRGLGARAPSGGRLGVHRVGPRVGAPGGGARAPAVSRGSRPGASKSSSATT